MKSDLQLLIDELQKQHDHLENELNSCIEGWDFISAEVYKESLVYTREQLRILKNLNTPNYDKIYALKKRIEFYSDFKSQEDRYLRYTFQRMNKKITEFKKELLKLENIEKRAHIDSDELIICFEEILSQRINQFELEVEAILFKILRTGNELKIELTRTDKKSLDYTMTKIGSSKLKKMGFQVEDKTAIKIVREFQVSKILPIISIISRIIFEVFKLYGNKKARLKL